MKFAAQALVLLALSLTAFSADVVVPVGAVENSVNVRMEADAKSEIVGKLLQGSSLPFQRSVSGWHEVQLEDDAYGYVSADWALVITAEEFAVRQEVEEAADAEVVEEVADVEDIEEFVEEDEEVEKVADVEEAEETEETVVVDSVDEVATEVDVISLIERCLVIVKL